MRCPNRFIYRCLAFLLCLLMLWGTIAFSANSLTYNTSSTYSSGVFYSRLTDVELTGDPRVDIVNVALSQYGYSEANGNSDLSGMVEGYHNYTEYGHWYGVQSLWCAMFVSWCAYNAGISNDVIPPHAYTASGVLWFMDRGQSHSRSSIMAGEYTPQAGDIIYFRSERNDSIVNHVGIVIGYFDGYVYTVEGNINFDPNCTDGGQVLVRCRHISDTIIRYICAPNYSSDLSHEVGAFFPTEPSEPIVQTPQITLGQPGQYIDASDSTSNTASTLPQYSFIP